MCVYACVSTQRIRFRLWLDVSPFEQREHGLSVAGILTTAVKVVHKADPKEAEGSATTPTAVSHDGKGPRVSTRKRKAKITVD
jgi:hypothetical protein